MGRRKPKVELTLFPFLSVLAGLIAVLMLFMIVTLSTQVLDVEKSKPLSRRPKNGTQGSSEVKDGIDNKTYEEFNWEIDRLENLLSQRVKEYEELAAHQQALLDLIAIKKTELKVIKGPGSRQTGIKLGEPTPVDVVPVRDPGNEVRKKPVFIEVKAEGYVVHPEKTLFPPILEEKTASKTGPQLKGLKKYKADLKLKAFLDSADKKRAEEYLLFLLHPNGITVFMQMRFYLIQEYPTPFTDPRPQRMDIGSEPFSREWTLFAK